MHIWEKNLAQMIFQELLQFELSNKSFTLILDNTKCTCRISVLLITITTLDCQKIFMLNACHINNLIVQSVFPNIKHFIMKVQNIYGFIGNFVTRI